MSADFFDTLEDTEPMVSAPLELAQPARIFASGWGTRADRIILAKVADIGRAGGRYQNRGTFLETNYSGDGFYLERGGIWNDTSGRVGLGCTKQDVADLRSALRAIGVVRSLLAVEAALASALHIGSAHATLSRTEEFAMDHKEYWRKERAARVAKLRAAGMCTMCGKERVDGGRATCHPCGAKANARAKRRKIAAA
jgi:hypothetical protein